MTKLWPLLTVETEANGDSRSTNERGPAFVGPLCLGCSSWPSTNSFSSPYTISVCLSSSPSKLARQSCRVACLFYVRLWWWHWLSVLLVIILCLLANPNSTQWTVSVLLWGRAGKRRFFCTLSQAKTRPSFVLVLLVYSQLNDWDSGGSTVPIQRRNSWKYNFVEVSGHCLEISRPLRFQPLAFAFLQKAIHEETWISSLIACFVNNAIFKGKQRETKPSPHPLSGVAV